MFRILGFIASTILIFPTCNTLAEQFPVDIVYTWVDGSDPEWQNTKNQYLKLANLDVPVSKDSSSDSRFNDHQELRYSLRSIWKYAPFIRHIYVVTMGQTPHWFSKHEKISFVDHKDIYLDLEDLPTFNSQSIETHLHRIKGLSEYFIYFNDDVFLGNPVKISDFFDEKGHPLVLLEPFLSPKGSHDPKETVYRSCWRNNNRLLDYLYTSCPRFRLCHAPFALRKSFIEESEVIFPFVFKQNSARKFRCELDYNITNGLLQYDWLHRQKCSVGHLSNLMISLRGIRYQDRNQAVLELLNNYNPTTFCIEDVTDKKNDDVDHLLIDFLQKKYPEAAPWENN